MHWLQREREYLMEMCWERGLEVEIIGEKRDNYTIPEYKATMQGKRVLMVRNSSAHSYYKVKVTEPIIIGKAFYDDHALVLRLYEGEHRMEYSACPNFGPNWVGEYELAIIDILSEEVVYNYLLKEWRKYYSFGKVFH